MMRTITLEESVDLAHPVVTVGTFDGVHTGHASVVASTLECARKHNGTSVVITFDPHPRQVIDPTTAPGLLTSLAEKQDRLEALGVDVLAVIRFDASVQHLSPEAFVRQFLVEKLNAKSVIVGYDHSFGKDRQGGLETMLGLGKSFGFSVESPPASLVDGAPVSSTRIREALAKADMSTLLDLMGNPYPLWGRVVEGEKRGRSLGFPTANLEIETPGKLMPPAGVYTGLVRLDKPYLAVVNYGKRPTFGGQKESCEVHLLNFSQDLYGRVLPLEICHRIRGEREFESKEALIEQIRFDIQSAEQMFLQSNTTLLRR